MTGLNLVEDSVLFRADATKSDTAGEVWLLTKSKPIMCWLHTLAKGPMSSMLRPSRLRMPDSA